MLSNDIEIWFIPNPCVKQEVDLIESISNEEIQLTQ
jgi:hypothetical protein